MKDRQATIAIIGTLDTKGEEVDYLCQHVAKAGLQITLIDLGILGEPLLRADVPRQEVAEAGGSNLAELVQEHDSQESIKVMTVGAAKVLGGLYDRGRIQGVLAIGGARGTAIGLGAMTVLPLGVPKVMLTAAGDLSAFGETRDVVLMPTVVDLAGLNRLSKRILRRGAAVIAALVGSPDEEYEAGFVVGMSSFGATTSAVVKIQHMLEARGYEVVIFPATGAGGKALEELIEVGEIEGVVDLTLSELADELVGGVLSAGPRRLEAAGQRGIPQLVAPGAIDMVNFGALETVPLKFKGRKLYQHAPTVTLLRTTAQENVELGRVVAHKLNRSKGPTGILIPLKGFSAYDRQGEVFFDPGADAAFVRALRQEIANHVKVVELDCHINDDLFAQMATDLFCQLAERGS